ncbi:MAG: hypothetical protein IJK84_03030 [Bacteroidales bacterium]|nr:hypothetical protein [Bacteroidales bacterium]
MESGQTYCKSGANLDFHGLDRLTAKHVVAAGGDYWMMKDIITDDPTTCYGVATQAVDELTLSYYTGRYCPYFLSDLSPSRQRIGLPLPRVILQGGCITF